VLEGRGIAASVGWKLSDSETHGKKHVHLVDSFSFAQALDKMRATNQAMLQIVRRVAALTLATNTSFNSDGFHLKGIPLIKTPVPLNMFSILKI
jgi:hypothetical protein